MVVPDTKVFIAFDLTASGQNFFVLDDAVKGELDSSYILGGTLFQDVTSYVESVSISRGKSRQLERYSAGNLSVTLHNESRIFGPFNTTTQIYYCGNKWCSYFFRNH
jgi:hypothetical protein